MIVREESKYEFPPDIDLSFGDNQLCGNRDQPLGSDAWDKTTETENSK